VTKAENLCPGRPGRHRQGHLLVALGHAAVAAGHKVRYLAAAELVEQLYRGVADNSVGRVIDTLLRHDLVIVDEVGFAPLDDTGTQLLFRFVAAGFERRALGIASHWLFEQFEADEYCTIMDWICCGEERRRAQDWLRSSVHLQTPR
jgi:IstB-like ATP binding protein